MAGTGCPGAVGSVRRGAVALAVLGLAVLVPAGPSLAGTGPPTVTTSLGSVTVSAPDVQWSQPSEPCEQFPVDYAVTFDQATTRQWVINGQVRTPGRQVADYVGLDGRSPGSVRDPVRLCDDDGYGPMSIVGEVWFQGADGSTATAALSVPFAVSRMKTSIRVTIASREGGTTYVRGKAVAASPTLGQTGAFGSVKITYRAPGRGWRTFGVTPATGWFEWRVFRALPAGTQFRAQFLANAKQESSTSAIVRLRA